VAVVGGGNSAGQAALFLSSRVAEVHLIVRGVALGATMSDYLIQRILGAPNIILRVNSEITELHGSDRLDCISIRKRCSGTEERVTACSLFVMIGAIPNTDWLGAGVETDPSGFIRTGMPCGGTSPHATSQAGVFAVGDVRSGSIKRVASAVGEGSVVVSEIHQYLSLAPVRQTPQA